MRSQAHRCALVMATPELCRQRWEEASTWDPFGVGSDPGQPGHRPQPNPVTLQSIAGATQSHWASNKAAARFPVVQQTGVRVAPNMQGPSCPISQPSSRTAFVVCVSGLCAASSSEPHRCAQVSTRNRHMGTLPAECVTLTPISVTHMAHRSLHAQVFFWDRRTGKLPVSCAAARHASGQLTSLQAVPDGHIIYAGTEAGEVRPALPLTACTETLMQDGCPRQPNMQEPHPAVFCVAKGRL